MNILQSKGSRMTQMVTVVCAVMLVLGVWPTTIEAQTTTRVSVATGGGQGNGETGDSSMSADGRFVAFESLASNLVPGDTNGVSDIFVHDRQTGVTTRVSVATGGGQGNGVSSQEMELSADGRIVVFHSEATNLVPGDTNGIEDIFVHDRQTGVTTRVSVATGGGQALWNGQPNVGTSENATISADGRFVAFESFANNLVPGDTNGQYDVFVHDRQTGVTSRVSVTTGGGQGFGGGGIDGSGNPRLSADGRFVAFKSLATNLVPGDTNGQADTFVHDRQTGVTTRVSVATGGGQASGGNPALSADGRYVVFPSEAINLVPGDSNGVEDIFVHDRQAGVTTRVSVATGGGQANGPSDTPRLSADGRFVAFESLASNLVPGDTNGVSDIFVHDRQTGVTTRVSVATGGGQGNGRSSTGWITSSGRFVSFDSDASNLVAGDTNGVGDIFVHDRGIATVGDPNSQDTNGDGRADVVWRNTTNGATHVWQMTASALRGPVTFPGGVATNWVIRGIADVNGDGRADLVWRNTNNGGTMVWQMTAGATRGPITFPGGVPLNWALEAVADVNGDGRADLVWRNMASGGTMVWQMTAGATRGPITFPGGLPTNWVIQDVADVNGDGRADLVWRNTNNGATHVWQMTASGTRGPVTFPGGLPMHWQIQAVADVNGDGRADLVWRNTNNGATHVWQMTASGTRGPVTFPGGLPTNWQIQAVADVNGDGRADLVWRNMNNGATHVWQITAGALRGPVTFPGGLPLNWEGQP